MESQLRILDTRIKLPQGRVTNDVFLLVYIEEFSRQPRQQYQASIDSFSPLRERWQYLDRSGRWSVQVESEVTPSEAVGLFKDLTAMSRSLNGAVFVNGETIGGPWEADRFPVLVNTYELTYAGAELIPLA